MTVISKIIAENQITNGGPSKLTLSVLYVISETDSLTLCWPVILVQAENEFSASANNSPYMQDVIDTYRSNGVVVRASEQTIFLHLFD